MLRSHSLPWQLHWLPDPSWSIPVLHSQSELGIGDREQPGPTGTSEPSWAGDGIRDQPGSAARPFPAPSQHIKGLGTASCSGVSRACGQEGLDGAGIAPKWGSDLSLRVLLDHPMSPRPDPAAPHAAGEMGIPCACAAGLCPISHAEKQEESISCCAQAQEELPGMGSG